VADIYYKMARRLAPLFYLGINLLLAGSIVWLAAGRLAIGPAAILTSGIVCIEIGLWYAMMRSRQADTPTSNRLVSIMERSAHARRFSIRDETTGLLNRWYLERRLDEEASRCKRYGYSMAVIVLKAGVPQLSGMSLDEWQEGSTDAAQRCLSVVRNVDLSALLGPLEFAICLVHCDREGAEAALARLVTELREYNCTAGISVLPEDDVAPNAMIELARVRSQQVDFKKTA
jgi:GGDEF domain-containing protein